MAVGGVADVRRLAVNVEGLKVIATNDYKKTTSQQALVHKIATKKNAPNQSGRFFEDAASGQSLADTVLAQVARLEFALGGRETEVIR